MSGDKAGGAAAVRRRAEEIVAKLAQAKANAVRPPEDTAATLHELLVHQIELEMQNEELRQSHVALDASRARYFNLFDMAPVGYVTLDQHGVVLEANLAAGSLLGVIRGSLISKPFSRMIHKEDANKFFLLCKALVATALPQSCELRMVFEHGLAEQGFVSALVAGCAIGFWCVARRS